MLVTIFITSPLKPLIAGSATIVTSAPASPFIAPLGSAVSKSSIIVALEAVPDKSKLIVVSFEVISDCVAIISEVPPASLNVTGV